jgi:hypothetical protein
MLANASSKLLLACLLACMELVISYEVMKLLLDLVEFGY